MLKQSLILLLLIHVISSTESPEKNEDPDKAITVCKRVTCMDCEESYDDKGCPFCDCEKTDKKIDVSPVEEDPCSAVNCGSHEECILEKSANGPDVAVCQGKEPCPVYRCMSECKFGYKKDKSGCPSCECKKHTCEDHKCGEGKVCQPKTAMCFDLPCPKLPSCVWKPLCSHQRDAWLANKQMHVSPFLQGRVFAEKGASLTADKGHLFGEDEASLGPNGSGAKKHLLGEDEASRGPQEALLGEDEASLGPNGSGPHKHLLGEDEASRGPVHSNSAKDSKKHLLGSDEASKGPIHYFPQCDEQGDFLPLQCDVDTGMCWCVDDSGMMKDETLTDMNKATKKPVCPYNRTTAIHGNMKIEHDIDDIQPHLSIIKKVAHNQLSEWLVIDKEFISITEMRPCPIEIHTFTMSFSIFADDKGQNDLAAASFHLQTAAHNHDLSIPYHGHTLRPKAESINMHHQFEPQLPQPGIRERVRNEVYFTQHRMAILAGLLGVTFFLLVILVLLKMMLAKRRMRTFTVKESGHNYKENLKFAQKFFNKGDVKDDKLGPLTELEAGNDSVA